MSEPGNFYGVPPQAIADGYPSPHPEEFCSHSADESGLYETASTCFEAKDITLLGSLETTVLLAEGTLATSSLVYPEVVKSLSHALLDYDEPLYPIPVGASIFFFTMFGWMTTFYMTQLGRKLLLKFITKLDLYPEAHRFPDIPLYWLQQTKKESELRREVRNTWAWLAKRYRLSSDDPLLTNEDDQMTWHDFEVSRNTQSVINTALKVNDLYLKVQRGESGKREFEILKDVDPSKLTMDGGQPRRIFMEVWKPPKTEEEIEAERLEAEAEAEAIQATVAESVLNLLSKPTSKGVTEVTAVMGTFHAKKVWKSKLNHPSKEKTQPSHVTSQAKRPPPPKEAPSTKWKAVGKPPPPSSKPTPTASTPTVKKNTPTLTPSKRMSRMISMRPIDQQPEPEPPAPSSAEVNWELPPLTPPIQENSDPKPPPSNDDAQEEDQK